MLWVLKGATALSPYDIQYTLGKGKVHNWKVSGRLKRSNCFKKVMFNAGKQDHSTCCKCSRNIPVPSPPAVKQDATFYMYHICLLKKDPVFMGSTQNLSKVTQFPSI